MVTAGIYAKGGKIINNYFCTVHNIDSHSPMADFCYATNGEFGVINNNSCIGTNAGVADYAGNLINIYSVSSDATADDFAGINNIVNQDPITDIRYVSIVAYSEDLHILIGSSCQDNADAFLPLPFDVDNEPRPSGAGWDRGADEIQELPHKKKKNQCCCGCGAINFHQFLGIKCMMCK